MDHTRLLDVTLRDGGYKTNFHFSYDFIEKFLTDLEDAGIDYIEVGYRNGSFKPMANIGISGLCDKVYLKFCKRYLKSSKLTVMYHPRNVGLFDLAEMHELGVDSVRICFPANNPKLGFQAIKMAQKHNFEIFVNITRLTELSAEQILNLSLEITKYNIHALYLADSNGSLTPDKTKHVFATLRSKMDVDFGFHAHDNLFCAQANAIEAINNNVKYIDSSVLGLGKGVGNLKTEGIISFLCAQGNFDYNLCKVLNLAEYASSNIKKQSSSISQKDIIMGVFNLSQDDANRFGPFLDINHYYSLASCYAKEKGDFINA